METHAGSGRCRLISLFDLFSFMSVRLKVKRDVNSPLALTSQMAGPKVVFGFFTLFAIGECIAYDFFTNTPVPFWFAVEFVARRDSRFVCMGSFPVHSIYARVLADF